MNIGANIRKFRRERGYTQKKLGELCGIAEPNIRKYESGKQNPKFETIEKIASALETTVLDLMGVEYWDEKYPDMGREAEQPITFGDFLKSAGYSMEILPEGEEGESCTVELTKDGHSAEFTQSEFEELENCAKEAIDGSFYKKVVEQQHKK